MRNITTFLLSIIVAVTAAAQPVQHKRLPSRAGNQPTVLPATDITETGFVANWEAMTGAEGYTVSVYTKTIVPEDGNYMVMFEDFSLVTEGSFIEPVYAEEPFIDLSDPYLDWVYMPNWGVYSGIFAAGMVGGIIYTTYMDLTNNGGKFTVRLGLVGYGTQVFRVWSYGNDEVQEKEVTLADQGYNMIEVEFTNGAHDTFLKIVDYGFPNAPDPYAPELLSAIGFLDDFEVVQNLKEGDEVLQLIDINESIAAPATSFKFDPMRYLYDEKKVYYDVLATFRDYYDPYDPYAYDQYYSDYSELQEVKLLGYQEPSGPTGGEDDDEAGIDAVAVGDFAVDCSGGMLRVDTPATVDVNIYALDGSLVATGTSTEAWQLNAGIYVVKAGNMAKKVAITH